MYVDYLTLACLRDSLDSLLGARVQRVVLVDDLAVGLELYAKKRHQLLISAHPQHARMLLGTDRLRRGVEGATPLLLLLRKWLRRSRLVDVTQPPGERVLALHFEGKAGPCRLIAELIGRYANVVLVGPDGYVLDALKRIGPKRNRERVTLPRHPYQLPPRPVGRWLPTQVPASEWTALLAAASPEQPLHRLLTQRLFGVSPMVGREIAARVGSDPEAPVACVSAEEVATAVAQLFAPLEDGSWAPHVALDEAERAVAFAPYRPRQYPHVEPTASISEALRRYFQAQLTADAYAAGRRQVQAWIDQAMARVDRALAHLRAQALDEEEIEALREAGELLLAHQPEVGRGEQEVTLPDFAGTPRTLKLDPRLTPVENAQAYFRRYRKAKRGSKEIPARTRTLEMDRAYMEQLAADLALAESRPEIDAVREALSEAGWAPKPRRPGTVRTQGPRRFEAGGFPIYVGRNARQNQEVTFRLAGSDDLWLHVQGLPGAHVVIKSGGQTVPEDVLRRAAELAAYYSPARDGGPVAVDVAERRFVRRVRHKRPGLVTYRHRRTLTVEAKAGRTGPD